MADQLDSGPDTGSSTARHAVVVGGGVAGLLAARALADHAERVTVVERDRFPRSPNRGRRAAGAPHPRAPRIGAAGPGAAPARRRRGVAGGRAPRVGVPRDMVQHQAGMWYRRTEATFHFFCGSRPLLEHVVRRRVLADPRVEALEGTEAVGSAGDAARVRGLLVRERGPAGAAGSAAAGGRPGGGRLGARLEGPGVAGRDRCGAAARGDPRHRARLRDPRLPQQTARRRHRRHGLVRRAEPAPDVLGRSSCPPRTAASW